MKTILLGLIIWISAVQFTYTASEEPVIFGNWKLIKVYGGNAAIDKHDIGKVVIFSKEGKCLSYMENFPKDAEYKFTKGFSYASGRNAWLMTFSNTLASNYEVLKSKDTLYLLCSCSEGRHFVFMPTKDKPILVKPDTIKSKKQIVIKGAHVTPQPPNKSAVNNRPIKKEIPKYKSKQPVPIKKVILKAKPKPHVLPAKKIKVDSTGM